MSAEWVVTAAAERVVLSDQGTGETTFTVTNSGRSADRAVFDVVAGDGADNAWFTVDEPQRLVRPGASVAYLMKVAVPAGTASGSYDVQGRVYSVDAAPEESSVLSPRVMLEVPAKAPPPVKRRPWWLWLIIAAVVLVLLVVVGVVVLGGGEEEPAPIPTPQSGEVLMPDLIGQSEREALRTLAELGLTVRPITYRHDPDNADEVVRQSLDPDTAVSIESVVDLEVAIELEVPDVTEPADIPMIPVGESAPTLRWESSQSPVRRWQVSFYQQECILRTTNSWLIYYTDCYFLEQPTMLATVDVPEFTPQLVFGVAATPNSAYHSGWVGWRVAALDDFGAAGPASELAVYHMRLTFP